MTVEGVATADPEAPAGVRPDAAASLQALHRAVLELTAPLTAEPGMVRARFGRLAAMATETLGATEGALVLQREPAWDALLLEHGGEAADARLVAVSADGRCERWKGRPDGVLAKALSSGESLYVPDAGAHSPFGPFPRTLRVGVRAFAVVPLRLGGETLGVLAIGYPTRRTLGAAERELLDLFAAHGAALVERARRVYAEHRRADQQQRMAAILAELAAVADMEEALSALVRGAVALLGGVQGTARVYTQPPALAADAHATALTSDGGAPAKPAAAGEEAFRVILQRNGELEVRRRPWSLRPGSFAAALYAGSPPVLVDDAWTLDPAVYPHAGAVRREGVRSSVNVPIQIGGRRIGSLHVDHPQPGFFAHEDLLLAQTLAAQAGAAIERVRTEETRRAASAGQARLDGALLVARTVAHEINNAISPVLGFAELLALRPSVIADPSATAYTTHITAAANETAAKIRRLQQIVRLEQAESPLGESVPVLDLERSAQNDAAR